jgi:anti-sigma regulatory factor (Ser/Thr protein kinase)
MDGPVLEDEERLILPRGPASVAEARRFVSSAMGDHELKEVALLLASELSTNAVDHAAGDSFEVRVRLDGVVRVEVSDGSTTLPEPVPSSEERAGGRGLLLVEAFASDWGVQVQQGGKTVWFELAPMHSPQDEGGEG